MNIKTGFNLFVRQALLYPLTSPFLPAVADVKKNVSYANGELIGTLESGAPVLTWSSVNELSFYFDDAVLYAQYLESDGVTVSEIPQNIWRLPTMHEFMSVVDYSIYTPASLVSPAFNSLTHWSGDTCAFNSEYAWDIDMNTGYITFNEKVAQPYNVRCVLI